MTDDKRVKRAARDLAAAERISYTAARRRRLVGQLGGCRRIPLQWREAKLADYAIRATLILLAAGGIDPPTVPRDETEAVALGRLLQHTQDARNDWESDGRDVAVFDVTAERLASAQTQWKKRGSRAAS